ncbi:hypothetical protein bplSymb_SCF11003P001 [Bathymodiolus platifrons methanotrophic gill symbiont]|uniref:hypothetical protein n=1 Tax=Bathymodiolus platifrons methanotrophic gill symbiont TaxID=113268 RepID=UPI000B40DB41|nr:hypothetical protein [Bathymodiolus platifrons methanotrophic gill symbiont]TXK93767.1 hypothetical protein BMR02_14760 [Methylococcaceae bacterium HT1]TXL12815.1 hypothetical protein BMR05_14125 [Methylococcaceae bacterium HT4]TXL17406.1 hypothetical protein BMR06_14905 [Methylococcaceae bacterium HT5]TXL17450.1 hypothetical protein BMR04_05805 [Methylococcaceae bacterium HT3]TXL22550.1 hypothetical protein BMR03_07665 [Methylococcaceae bacterium HT2]
MRRNFLVGLFIFFSLVALAFGYYFLRDDVSLDPGGVSSGSKGDLDLLGELHKHSLANLESKGGNLTLEEEFDKNHLLHGGVLVASDKFVAENPEYVAEVRRNFKEMEEVGFFMVASSSDLNDSARVMLERMSKYATYSPEDVHADLSGLENYVSFVPTDLESSSFADLLWLGSNTFGSASSEGWSGVMHFFKDDSLGLLSLVERRGGAGGYTVQFLEEEFNTNVNGLPARYTVEVDVSGGANTTLTWQNGDNVYFLTAQVDVSGGSSLKDSFFKLAGSLPNPGGS